MQILLFRVASLLIFFKIIYLGPSPLNIIREDGNVTIDNRAKMQTLSYILLLETSLGNVCLNLFSFIVPGRLTEPSDAR